MLTACISLTWPGAIGQVVPLHLSGIVGAYLLRPELAGSNEPLYSGIRKRAAILILSLFAVLLVLLPMFASWHSNERLQLADIGYRAGSLVFGGGHVVLPMLHEATVSAGIVTEQQFLAGYGAVQAVPGPLLTFAAYIGAASAPGARKESRAPPSPA